MALRGRASLVASLALAGCGYRTQVTHWGAPDLLAPREAHRLQRIELLLPSPPQAAVAANYGGLERPLTRAELQELAQRAVRSLNGPGFQVVAGPEVGGPVPAARRDGPAPTAVLWFDPALFIVKQEEIPNQGANVVARLSLGWHLAAAPGGPLLAEGKTWGRTRKKRKFLGLDLVEMEPEPWASEVGGAQVLLEESLKRLAPALFDQALEMLRTDLFPHPIVGSRKLEKGEAALRAGFARARNGDWAEAGRLWMEHQTAHPGDWRAPYNLGVYYERVGHRGEALQAYRTALARAREESDRERLLGILSEVQRMAGPQAPTPRE